LEIIPVVGRFMPHGLTSYGVRLSAGGGQEYLFARMGVAGAVAVVCLWLAAWVLKRREG